jgi:hypothetical protein
VGRKPFNFYGWIKTFITNTKTVQLSIRWKLELFQKETPTQATTVKQQQTSQLQNITRCNKQLLQSEANPQHLTTNKLQQAATKIAGTIKQQRTKSYSLLTSKHQQETSLSKPASTVIQARIILTKYN